ncbi:MAG: DUF4433 domain-containing protein [Proteobacteria bacterium]|nr:DUF4433 domain-containing protein [Pseudomonadota bacterium]MCH8091457.1 DUF4433 domain-containing protein [Pseudomonadota bacterium]MCH8097516.1 DUF4433 domain-containing protein [Pseudomonadota bacterium]
MRREELEELQYITPIVNVPSILTQGILSHKRVKSMPHQSVAKPEVQALRAKVHIPGGRPLHEYANLYVCARNPMLYKRQADHQSLCVLRIATSVLDLPDVVITDQNAASDYRRFAAAPGGLAIVDKEKTFAEHWTHPDDPIAYWRHSSMKCAEVLVPDVVDPDFIMGAYVSCKSSHDRMAADTPGLPAEINRHFFFC